MGGRESGLYCKLGRCLCGRGGQWGAGSRGGNTAVVGSSPAQPWSLSITLATYSSTVSVVLQLAGLLLVLVGLVAGEAGPQSDLDYYDEGEYAYPDSYGEYEEGDYGEYGGNYGEM